MPVFRQPPASLYTVSGQRKYLTAAERARFLQAARECTRGDLRTLCLFLAHTGCRVSEALAVTPRSVEFETGFVAIRSLKKRNRAIVVREIPAPPELLAELRAVHPFDGTPMDRRLWPISRSRAWYLVKTVMTAAGIADGPHATAKGLRHGFGVHAIRSDVPLNLVQRWLGRKRVAGTVQDLKFQGMSWSI